MKTINSFRSKLLALTLALMASVSSFAYDEMPDFQVDGLYYNFLEGDNVEVTHPYRPALPTESASNAATQDSPDDYANLTELTIPSTVTYEGNVYHVTRIGHHAFDQCENLTSVDIPNSIKSIGIRAFSWCSALTSIVLKGGLENIESYAFEYCLGLENISLPNSLMTIGQNAFYNTQWYKNQPNGGVYVGNVFYKYKGDIPQNTSFVIKEGTVSISPYAFVKENYHEDYSLVSVSIPNSVKVIGEGVFYRCRALTSIVIPAGVTTIETLAFDYCKALKSVTCEAVNPPALSGSVFLFTPIADATLYVPAESIEAYKTATEWKDFGQILPIEPTSYKSQWCNTWNLFTHSGGARLDSEETWQYKLDRDTIINGKLYSTVIYYLTSDPSREYYMGAVRFGDDRKVYRAIGNSESVVYDFTAQVGDTLGPGVVYDVEVDSLTNLKTIYFHPYDRYEDKYIEYATVKWIEGVGSTDGFLLAKDYGTVGGASFYLLCAYRDDELKYAANKELGCRYNAGEVTHEHFPTLAGLSRTIHEERSTNDTTRRDDFTKVVLDLSFPTLYHSQMYLRERDNKIFVESRTYKNLTELYEYVLYDFTLEVGDSLPMLYIDYSSRGDWGPTYPLSILNVVNYRKEADGTIYPGDTLVVTEVSTITLLDGKEYKKWTFNNGMEYAEGIGSLSGDFYELIANKRTTEDLTASQLVCASQNGQLLYQMDDAEMERLGAECLCDYNSGPLKDNAKNGKIGGRPTPTQWNMLEVETKEMDGTPTILRAETFSYTLENDSIVAKGKTFYQLARQSTKDTAITKSFVGALHFGEDEDNRVYFLCDGVEYVLYDFTAEPGDTIEIFAGINNYPHDSVYTHVVTGKDTLENGACRMMLEVVFPDETSSVENAQKVWLAGLGSIDGIVHNAATRATKARSSETQTSVMLCAWRDDDCLYTTDHPDYDSYGCVYNLPTSIKDIETPGGKYQKIIRDGHLYIIHNGTMYNVIGLEVK